MTSAERAHADLHEQSVGATDEWYTPAYVFEAMGVRFDMDPAAASSPTPSDGWCDHHDSYDGLIGPWNGFVWLNPPFGRRNGIAPWLGKFRAHRNGIALTPDRTSAPWWQEAAADMDLLLFVSPKIRFIDSSGRPGTSPAQGTSLMALGDRGCAALRTAASRGLGILCAPAKSLKGTCHENF